MVWGAVPLQHRDDEATTGIEPGHVDAIQDRIAGCGLLDTFVKQLGLPTATATVVGLDRRLHELRPQG